MSEVYEGFIDLGSGALDVKEPQLVGNGVYSLEILDAKGRKKEEVLDNILVRVKIQDAPDAANILHTIYLPKPGVDEPEKIKNKQLFAMRFMNLFNLRVSPDGKLNTTEWAGATAKASVKLSTYPKNDGTDGQKNEIVLPPLPKK